MNVPAGWGGATSLTLVHSGTLAHYSLSFPRNHNLLRVAIKDISLTQPAPARSFIRATRTELYMHSLLYEHFYPVAKISISALTDIGTTAKTRTILSTVSIRLSGKLCVSALHLSSNKLFSSVLLRQFFRLISTDGFSRAEIWRANPPTDEQRDVQQHSLPHLILRLLSLHSK